MLHDALGQLRQAVRKFLSRSNDCGAVPWYFYDQCGIGGMMSAKIPNGETPRAFLFVCFLCE